MLDAITKPIAQALLQARLDGELTSHGTTLATIMAKQPADGLRPEDFDAIGKFVAELAPCNAIPAAKELAAKYGLDIAT